jgi:E3 ubiquitin-protein ligase SIAH1
MKTSYYERDDHEKTCPDAPCFCPDTGCSFSGSTAMLQEHFTAEHQWPSIKFKYDWCFYANIQEGICVIPGEEKQLFLLNVVSESFGCVISVFSVWP